MGCYVFSPTLTMEMFQSESAYDAERLLLCSLFEDLLRQLPTRTKRYRAETVCSISDSKMPALLSRRFRGEQRGFI